MADNIGGKVSGFFKNIGGKINDATFDLRADGDFDKNSLKYTVYTGAGALSHVRDFHAEKHVEDGVYYILTRGTDDDIKPGHVIGCAADSEVRYITAIENATLVFEFEGKRVERPSLKITIGDLAEKVDVIKVNDSFYLKK